MVVYKTNFDYEYDLFDQAIPDKQRNKINSLFEFIFFYLNDNDYLLSNRNYSHDFIKKVEKISNREFLLIEDSKDHKNWWGAKSDINLEKRLNSKITSHEIELDLNIQLKDSCLIDQKVKAKTGYLLKAPYGFSGRDQFIFSPDKEARLKNILKKTDLIQEPFVRVVKNIGSRVDLENLEIIYSVENFIDKYNQFVGGKLYQLTGEHCNEVLEVAKAYKKLGATGSIQIDSFFYENDQRDILFRPLVEANYRRSMGDLIFWASGKFHENCEVHFSKENLDGMILSPDNNEVKIFITD